MARNTVQTVMTLEEYRAKLREKTGYLLSLGGAAIALCFYNFAIYQLMKIEVYNHDDSLMNLDQITTGILDFKFYLETIVCLIPIFLILQVAGSSKNESVKVKAPKMLALWIYPILTSLVIIMAWLFLHYTQLELSDMESSNGAVMGIWSFIATNIIALIVFFIRKNTVGRNVVYDVKVMTPLVASYMILVFVSGTYFSSLYFVANETEISIVKKEEKKEEKVYYVVAKEQDKLLLREIKKQEGNDFYYPTSIYKFEDVKNLVIEHKEMTEPVGNKLSSIEFLCDEEDLREEEKDCKK